MSFLLYPGQGSQASGMGRDFYGASSEARAILDQAASLDGGDFLRTLFEGEQETLNDTRIAQPALLTVGAAITAYLKTRGMMPTGAAGHSLGEFTALVAAECLSFEEAFRLVQERARLMSEEVPEGTMAAVIGLEPHAIEQALPADVQVANYNGPQQTIISGTVSGIEAATKSLADAGAKRVLPLKVSGPFHSRLMDNAAEQFTRVLAGVTLKPPVLRFISSISGRQETDPARIHALLCEQICAPVRWTDVMRQIGPHERVIEAGPGKVLQGIAKRIENAPEVMLAGTFELAHALEVGQ